MAIAICSWWVSSSSFCKSSRRNLWSIPAGRHQPQQQQQQQAVSNPPHTLLPAPPLCQEHDNFPQTATQSLSRRPRTAVDLDPAPSRTTGHLDNVRNKRQIRLRAAEILFGFIYLFTVGPVVWLCCSRREPFACLLSLVFCAFLLQCCQQQQRSQQLLASIVVPGESCIKLIDFDSVKMLWKHCEVVVRWVRYKWQESACCYVVLVLFYNKATK